MLVLLSLNVTWSHITQSASHAVSVVGIVVVGRTRRTHIAEIVGVVGIRRTGFSA